METETELSKSRRIDLGLAILSVLAQPGARYTLADIAAFCDCTKGTVEVIERKAMAKSAQSDEGGRAYQRQIPLTGFSLPAPLIRIVRRKGCAFLGQSTVLRFLLSSIQTD